MIDLVKMNIYIKTFTYLQKEYGKLHVSPRSPSLHHKLYPKRCSERLLHVPLHCCIPQKAAQEYLENRPYTYKEYQSLSKDRHFDFNCIFPKKMQEKKKQEKMFEMQ